MKIWIDILTPKQLLFSEAIIEKFGKKHQILCTSREYDEVTKLAKIRSFRLVLAGKHGGGKKETKLKASIERMRILSNKIKSFSPDLAISFCSPEAARISFGLGIKHVAFCDSPQAEAVMRLTLPLIQKLLIPKTIPKKEFAKFGINEKDIISYNAIDAAVTIKRKIKEKNTLPFQDKNKKNILIRVEEQEAAYVLKSNKIISIIKNIIKNYSEENIVILGRYPHQIKKMQKIVGKKAKVVKMSFDGRVLLNNTDVFIGSGGTMTAESALMGVPTISYNAVPNPIENYLVKKGLVKREMNPDKINTYVSKIFKSSNEINQIRAKKITKQMEDPVEKLVKAIRD